MAAVIRGDTNILYRTPIVNLDSLDRTDGGDVARFEITKSTQPSRFRDESRARSDFAHQTQTTITPTQTREYVRIEFLAKALVLGRGMLAKQIGGIGNKIISLRYRDYRPELNPKGRIPCDNV